MKNELTVTINQTELPVKEYQGQRVVTLREVDTVHKRPEGTARKRFNDNKKHLLEGVDFFKVPANECPGIGQSIFDYVANSDGPRGIDYSGYLYIAFAPDSNLIKIGRTKNKAKRISSLNTGRTNKISEVEYFLCKDTLLAEKQIHCILEAHRETGEWFSIFAEEARRSISEVIADVDAHFDPEKRHKGGARADITLLTESGYLMLVKSFTDDLAWTVQRQLVNVYFRATPEQRKEAAQQTKQQQTPKRPALSSVNMAMKLSVAAMQASGVAPEYIVLALAQAYRPYGIVIPEDCLPEGEKLYECEAIAKELGVLSESGNPHKLAISAIIALVGTTEKEVKTVPFATGHYANDTKKFTASVLNRVAAWLEENSYPSVIQGLDGKRYKVRYKTAA